MGIDWEEQLGAEGADIAHAYEDSLPETETEYCGTVANHYSGSKDVVGAYIFNIMWDFNQIGGDWGLFAGDRVTYVSAGDPADPYHELEDKTCDELIAECIKLSQDAKHAKSTLMDAEQNLDTLLDHLDKFVVYSCNANRNEESRSELESKLEYEEESMCYDEMRKKYEAMTHEELMKKHIEISWIADAAKYFSKRIEWYYIKGLSDDLSNYFEGEQDLKDLIAKYKKPVPENVLRIRPRHKKIERKKTNDLETERKDQWAEFSEEDELPLD